MRRIVLALLLVVVVALAAARAAGRDRTAKPVSLPAGLSINAPSGWHVLRGWLSDVLDPAPRLALASFPARLSRQTCACGLPNVVHFPRDGVFIFAWEYVNPERAQLARAPERPRRFSVTVSGAVRQTCNGPSGELDFKDAGRVFQVEIYIGPAAGSARRAQVAAVLDSLRVAPGKSYSPH